MIQENSKVLVIRLSSLGDVILTTPVIRAISESFPSVKIDFLTLENYSDVYKHHPKINKLICYNKSIGAGGILPELLMNQYDLVIDLQNNIRSHQITKKLKLKTLRFNKPSLNKILLVRLKWNRFSKIEQIPEMYAKSIPGLKLDSDGLDIYLPGKIGANQISKDDSIAICPGSKHFTKMWPEEYYAELGIMLSEKGFKIKIIGGAEDEEICSRLNKKIPASENTCQGDDLFYIINEMKSSLAVVCNDSGLMHAACAARVPVIAIFGSTVREFGFFPYNCEGTVFEVNSLSCRPCSHVGLEKCPKGHFRCMREISPQQVHDKIREIVD